MAAIKLLSKELKMTTATATITHATPVLIVEVNPHRQSSTAWTGATTVGEVIRLIRDTTSFKNEKPDDNLRSNAGVELSSFIDSDGEFDSDAYNAWEEAQPIEAHFEAAIDCAGNDGHNIKVYWSKDDALKDGAPRYMDAEVYEKAVGVVF